MPTRICEPEHSAASWKEACIQKRAQNLESIPAAWRIALPLPSQINVVKLLPSIQKGIISALDIEITESTNINILLAKLATGEWTSVEVTTAFCKRAAIAHQLTNCLTEFWFEEAIARAAELDAIRASTGPVGMLHGLPVSLKDQFQIEGKECNMGWASWLGSISTEDSALVKILVAQGAVLYTRTNVSQSLMFPEGLNHVYGRTLNPFNRNTTTGGSSAGEGALLALKGSIVGFGTDVGGSIRIPANYNALYGLRPTTRRMTYAGAKNTLVGQEGIESTIGPLSTSLSGCVALSKVLFQSRAWDIDPEIIPIPWREDHYQLQHIGGRNSKLAFGFYDFDGVVEVLPPVRRAMKLVVDCLSAAGHEVIEWKCVGNREADVLFGEIMSSDGGEEVRRTVKATGETLLPNSVVQSTSTKTVYDTWQLNIEKTKYRRARLEQWMDTQKSTSTGRPIDGLICPVTVGTPPLHDQRSWHGYSSIYNFLDWPGLAVPVCLADKTVDDLESLSLETHPFKAAYDANEMHGTPIGVQLVGRRFQEEELLGIGEIVVEALAKFKAVM